MAPAPSLRDEAPTSGSLSACLLDGTGGARELDGDAVRAWRPEQGVLWVTGPAGAVGAWLAAAPGVDPADAAVFGEVPAQPWVEFVRPETLVLAFVQPAEGTPDPAAPGWTGAFHVWASPRLVATAGSTPAIADVRAALAQGRGPRDAADLLASASERAEDRTRKALVGLDDRTAAAEEAFDEDRSGAFDDVVGLRRSVLALRRRAAALRVAFERLRTADADWLLPTRRRWRELTRKALEDMDRLDALLDHVQALHDRHAHRVADRTNQVLYVVTLFTAIFAPLGFLAGVFGMNVGLGEGSVPGFSRPASFLAILAALAALGIVELRFLRRLRPR